MSGLFIRWLLTVESQARPWKFGELARYHQQPLEVGTIAESRSLHEQVHTWRLLCSSLLGSIL